MVKKMTHKELNALELESQLTHLGFYDFMEDVKVVPTSISQSPTRGTELHERIHQELVCESSFGIFQLILHHYYRQVSDGALKLLLRHRLSEAFSLSRFVQEGTASYIELLYSARIDKLTFKDMLSIMNTKYRNYMKKYEHSFIHINKLPPDLSTDEFAIVQIATKTVAVFAMDVPVLQLIDPEALLDDNLTTILSKDSPNKRLEFLLKFVNWSSLLEEGRKSFKTHGAATFIGKNYKSWFRQVLVRDWSVEKNIFQLLCKSFPQIPIVGLKKDTFVERSIDWQRDFINLCEHRFAIHLKFFEFQLIPPDNLKKDGPDVQFTLTTGGGQSPVYFPIIEFSKAKKTYGLCKKLTIDLLNYVDGPYKRKNFKESFVKIATFPYDEKKTMFGVAYKHPIAGLTIPFGYFTTINKFRYLISKNKDGIWLTSDKVFYPVFPGEYRNYSFSGRIYVSYIKSSTKLLIEYIEREKSIHTPVVGIFQFKKESDKCIFITTIEMKKVIYVFPLSDFQADIMILWLLTKKGIITPVRRQNFEQYVPEKELNTVLFFIFHVLPWLIQQSRT